MKQNSQSVQEFYTPDCECALWITVFQCSFAAFHKSSLIFAMNYVHFSKEFVKTAPHSGLPTKVTCNLT